MDHKALFTAIKQKQLKNLYLFEGVEENIKASALASLRKALLPEGMEDLNETLLENPPTSAIIAAAETLPFMADQRVVIIREHSALLRGESDDKLMDYLAHVPSTCVLIFYHRGKADGKKKLYKTIDKHGAVVSFNPLRDAELSDWIIQRFQKAGKSCSSQTASLLSFTSGSDTMLLRAEIDKLISYAADRTAMTDDDVRAVATRSAEFTVFNMVDAVVAGQETKAFALLRDMLTSGQERVGILAMLLRQYRILQQIKIMQYEKRSIPQMQEALGARGFIFDRYMAQSRLLTGGQVKQAVDICLSTEYLIKSGHLNQEGALEAAMLKLFAMRRT